MRVRRAATAVVLLLAGAAGGCREGVPPFAPPDRVLSDTNVWQLTFGPGTERDPNWLPTGDSLVYQTTSMYGTLGAARGILAAIPIEGRPARVLFPEVQLGNRLLATPVASPAGDRVAYIEVGRFDFSETCWRTAAALCESTQARLDSARLRVRRLDEVQPYTADPFVRVQFEGRTRGAKYAHEGPYYEPLIPLQAEHLAQGTMPFRPAWSPDGERLAYSDGLAVRIWRVGEPSADALPGTMDAAAVAWSPDGQWLAFTHLERGDSTTYQCECGHDENDTYVNVRVLYAIAARTIVLMRPDGSERRELGPGGEPAWSADGRFIYATHEDQIVRITVADGSVRAVPHTTRGRSPAVSPDGLRLAFARRKPDVNDIPQDPDIWIVALEP